MTQELFLVLGGTRSGKSRVAEQIADALGGPVVYLATALAGDDQEMLARISVHRQRRPDRWQTIEEPYDLAGVISRLDAGSVALVDDLSGWLGNLMLDNHSSPESVLAQFEDLANSLRHCPARVILVSDEVGLGIVPATPLGRQFRDLSGELNQMVAAVADVVCLVVAGIPLMIKPANSQPLAGLFNLMWNKQ